VDRSALSSRLIGALIVEKGLITEAQLEFALEAQQTTGALLGEILTAQFGVTRSALETALVAQRAENQSVGADEDSDANAAVRELARMLDEWGRSETLPKRPIGEIFVEKGFITSGQLEDALEEQKLSGRKLGEILVSQGKLSRLRLWDALEDQASDFEPTKPPGGTELPGLRVASDAIASDATPRALEPTVETWQPPAYEPVRPEHQVRPVEVEQAAPPAGADVSGLREEVEALAARLDAHQPSEEWRDAVTQLGMRVNELVDGSTESEAALQRLAEQLAEQLEKERGAGQELDAQVEALARRVEELAAGFSGRLQEISDTVSAAAGREQANALRHDLDQLRATLAALPTTTDDVDALTRRLTALDEELTSRLQHVTDNLAATATRDQAERLRRELDDLRATLDALPAQTDDVAALGRRVEQLSESFSVRLQQIGETVAAAVGRDEAVQHIQEALSGAATRDQAERLRRELDDVRATLDALPAPTDEVETLTRRVEHLSDSFSARLQQLGERLAGAAARDEADALRHDLDALRATIESLPLPTDEWRDGLGALSGRLDEIASASTEGRSTSEHLSARLDAADDTGRWRDERVDMLAIASEELATRFHELADSVAGAARYEHTDALRRDLDDLRGRFDAIPPPSDEWREAVAALAVQIDSARSTEEWRDAVAALAVRLDEVATPAEELRAELGSLSARLRNRVERLEHDVAGAASTEGVDAVSNRVDGLTHELEQSSGRLDSIARRLDELAPLHRVDELADTTAETASAHGAALDSIREELSAQAGRMQEIAEKRRADKANVRERLDAVEASLVDTSAVGAALEPLQAHLSDLDRRLSELASAQSSESRAGLDALREELHRSMAEGASSHDEALDALRRELSADASARGEALDALGHRLGGLESSLAEHAADHDADRHAELEALRADIFQRIEQVAATSAGRAELDALRARLEEEVSEQLERQGQDDAAAEATGQAIRDGLADLARRLTASEQAYFESGRSLRRSIDGLGLAITDADWHLRTGVAAEANEEATSYVAFVPAGDAYRLVECEGAPPYLGQIVDIEGFEDAMLRVSRLGRSPLPFDGRPCAYLERLSP
jgi:chromosome segregation ATPase